MSKKRSGKHRAKARKLKDMRKRIQASLKKRSRSYAFGNTGKSRKARKRLGRKLRSA